MRKALLIGINKYPTPNELNGCVHDVEQMRDLLTTKYGFAPGEIKTYLDREATLANMKSGLAWLAETGPGAGKDDVRVFQYSGHGSQADDKNGDEPDGADEALCPVDFDTAGLLIDDQLRVLYERVPKESSLVLFMDCCHSGNNNKPLDLSGRHISYRFVEPSIAVQTRIELAREKYLEEREASVKKHLREVVSTGGISDEDFQRLYAEAQAKFDRGRSRYGDVNNRENNLLLAGCRDNQTSADAKIDHAFHGAFTFYFADALKSLPATATYRDVMKATATSLKKERYEQIPQLEGRASRKDRPLFTPVR